MLFSCVCFAASATWETQVLSNEVVSLDQRLKSIDVGVLARDAALRGDPKRGALIFYTSSAACIKCHFADSSVSPLGPDLTQAADKVTDWEAFNVHIIESLLYPSRKIRKGYETHKLLTEDGNVISGMIVRETEEQLVLRDATNLEKEIAVAKDTIEERSVSDKSMMPDGLISAIQKERSFLDLASYLMEIAKGGQQRASELKPTPEQLVMKDDTGNLNHAAILQKLMPNSGKGSASKLAKALTGGKATFEGYCAGCHGMDGNTPSLATARAFGTQKLKFGSDPYSMMMTLSRGNGLMAATTHLSPKERYEVIQYIRERFMKGSNPGYEPITDDYLASLPKGSEMGDFKSSGDRDYGPALASQLGPDISSVLTVKIGGLTLSYNLHTLDQAGVWKDGFLDLDQTQHQRGRGEGYPEPKGKQLPGLAGWQWGHESSLDYSREGLLARGPLPPKWLEYNGHYLHDNQVVLSYAIDGREVLEVPSSIEGTHSVRRTLRIGPGKEIVVATAKFEDLNELDHGVMSLGRLMKPEPVALATGFDIATIEQAATEPSGYGSEKLPFSSPQSLGVSGQTNKNGDATECIAIGAVGGKLGQDKLGAFTASRVLGDTKGMTWNIDLQHRSVLRIPADSESRLIEVITFEGTGDTDLEKLKSLQATQIDPAKQTRGGELRWPQMSPTVGYLGYEKGAYAVDTISIPETTPWNTWFRTSAIDFFADGRMAVATTGGDVWIVSGVDNDLLNLRWKRFASGLYEPFGIKVVDGTIYVTCKDRLTRLKDFNSDGEADFYESFSADSDVSTFFHAFNFDLQTDSEGNFYYAKCGQYTDYVLPGAIIKVSPDGKKTSVVCTGLRTPNGLGILPDNRLTVSDNQGTWMPASKINLVKQDGFYGYVQTSGNKSWAPDGGKIDHKKVVPPTTFDQPMIWMPQDVDNSSGGQLWVDDKRWGPIAGRLLHTSFGKGWMFYVMMQEVNGLPQAAIVRVPHDFVTGIMRGRVNPVDGQVYVTGLNGWNDNGRPGLEEKGIQRVRYTGRKLKMITDCQVQSKGLKISFNFPLDSETASKVSSYVAEQWNYKWNSSYGSDMYNPDTGKIGKQKLNVTQVTLSNDRRSVDLQVPDIKPVNQLHLQLNLKDADGVAFVEEIYWTINAVPKQ